MSDLKRISTALISVYYKDHLEPVIKKLNELNIRIISTGGTSQYIQDKGIDVQAVEDLTSYPSILGGRVKTLHPKIFGGILARRHEKPDMDQLEEFDIPPIDLVIVDLYPFEETVSSGATDDEIIEKIDIGGISLIRAAAKNYKDILVISSREQYTELLDLLQQKGGSTDLEDRRRFATGAFQVSSHYDTMIFSYFDRDEFTALKQSLYPSMKLRYGENPHQKGFFFGCIGDMFDQLHGKEISYNNLLDIDAALNLISDFEEPTFAVLKHNNACGLASREKLSDAWDAALAGDPVSAYGGVLICNRNLDAGTAEKVNKIFFEVIIAPSYDDSTLEILKQKKNRIILLLKSFKLQDHLVRTILNGAVLQERDQFTETEENLKVVTLTLPDKNEIRDLLFANKIVKHTKSNAIVLVKNSQLLASGVGQTSRVDAVKHAIEKAGSFGYSLEGAVMASDAYFPFPDSIELAWKAGIRSVIQPGGSVRDQESIDFCNNKKISMAFTGIRHFKH